MARKVEYKHDKTLSDLIKLAALGGWSREAIRSWLIGAGYSVPNLKLLSKIYAQEFNLEKEFLLRVKSRAYQRAMESDVVMMFVLKCRGGWRETDRQEISFDEKPVINLVFKNDESIRRNDYVKK